MREIIAKRAAQEIADGNVVNLGIGVPTLIPQYIEKSVTPYLHSENGLVGMGDPPAVIERNPKIRDAGNGYVTADLGSSTFDSAMSFAIIRGGHLDVTFLGALQVDQFGNLANWMRPGKKVGMGGAMDLVAGAKRVIITMEHTSKGKIKIVEECTLPLTAKGKVDLIITEKAVIKVTDEGLLLQEIGPESCIDDIVANTGANLIIPEVLVPMAI